MCIEACIAAFRVSISMYGIGGQVDLTVSKISGSMVSYDSSFPALRGALMIEKNSPREMELWCLDL